MAKSRDQTRVRRTKSGFTISFSNRDGRALAQRIRAGESFTDAVCDIVGAPASETPTSPSSSSEDPSE